jgi:hypothetical protein
MSTSVLILENPINPAPTLLEMFQKLAEDFGTYGALSKLTAAEKFVTGVGDRGGSCNRGTLYTYTDDDVEISRQTHTYYETEWFVKVDGLRITTLRENSPRALAWEVDEHELMAYVYKTARKVANLFAERKKAEKPNPYEEDLRLAAEENAKKRARLIARFGKKE